MTRRERVFKGTRASEHIVQLFDCRESRADAVASFVGDGLAQGQPVLVVAKPQHWAAVERDLVRKGIDPSHAIAAGRVTVLDAADLLASFMRAERPDPALFRRHVGSLVRDLATSSSGPLSVYGEMVDLLAETGDFRAAADLEELWNDLIREHSVRLLCGYCSAHFGPEPASAALHAICCAHTRVQTTADDPLGEWLTANVRPTCIAARDNRNISPRT
jgi:hypothetical protein